MQPQINDYYQVLNIPRNASLEEIERAFRREILKWHPDRNRSPEASRRTQLILEARTILTNPEKKKGYDAAIIGGLGKTPDEAERLRRWQWEAQKYARKNAGKPLDQILREAALGTAKWLTGAALGVAVLVLVIGIVIWATEKSGGWDTPYVGWVYWGTFLVLYIGIFALKNLIEKALFFLRCEHCGKKVHNYHICQSCGQSGCLQCIGVPLDMEVLLRGEKVEYRCNTCDSSLRRVEKKSGLRDWMR